jgi:hypothetical protein
MKRFLIAFLALNCICSCKSIDEIEPAPECVDDPIEAIEDGNYVVISSTVLSSTDHEWPKAPPIVLTHVYDVAPELTDINIDKAENTFSFNGTEHEVDYSATQHRIFWNESEGTFLSYGLFPSCTGYYLYNLFSETFSTNTFGSNRIWIKPSFGEDQEIVGINIQKGDTAEFITTDTTSFLLDGVQIQGPPEGYVITGQSYRYDIILQ